MAQSTPQPIPKFPNFSFRERIRRGPAVGYYVRPKTFDQWKKETETFESHTGYRGLVSDSNGIRPSFSYGLDPYNWRKESINRGALPPIQIIHVNLRPDTYSVATTSLPQVRPGAQVSGAALWEEARNNLEFQIHHEQNDAVVTFLAGPQVIGAGYLRQLSPEFAELTVGGKLRYRRGAVLLDAGLRVQPASQPDYLYTFHSASTVHPSFVGTFLVSVTKRFDERYYGQLAAATVIGKDHAATAKASASVMVPWGTTLIKASIGHANSEPYISANIEVPLPWRLLAVMGVRVRPAGVQVSAEFGFSATIPEPVAP